MPIINTAALRVGDYVNIDNENRTGRRNSEGGKGYLETVQPTYNVRYVLTGLLSPNVNRSRIH